MRRAIAVVAGLIAAVCGAVAPAQTIRDQSGIVHEYSAMTAAQCETEWSRLLEQKDQAIADGRVDTRLPENRGRKAAANIKLRDAEARFELHERWCNRGFTTGKGR